MFLVHESAKNLMGERLAGPGHSGYECVILPGRHPFYLVEMPSYDANGVQCGCVPLILNQIESVLDFRRTFQKPLEVAPTSLIFHGFMTNSEDWHCKRITSIWNGRWTDNNNNKTCHCTRVCFSDGASVLLPMNKPNNLENVTWSQLM